MNHESLPLPECYIISNIKENYDIRGSFLKITSNISDKFAVNEFFYSNSCKNVIRGMHYCSEPQHKLVYCLYGEIEDVIVDINPESPTFKKVFSTKLSKNNAIIVGPNVAHGFKVLTDEAVVCYLVSTNYDKNTDCGIRYDSIDYNWNIENPILSDRDKNFERL